jgi:hypothetical protein
MASSHVTNISYILKIVIGFTKTERRVCILMASSHVANISYKSQDRDGVHKDSGQRRVWEDAEEWRGCRSALCWAVEGWFV